MPEERIVFNDTHTHAKQHADDCCKLARETLGYQEQAALKGGEI